MKIHQIKEYKQSEMQIKLDENIESLENLKFQKALQQLENPLQIKYLRREIAQLKTILHEYELGLRSDTDGSN